MKDAHMPINIAIVGVGNCASSLVQGLTHYAGRNDAAGLMHHNLGGYRPDDIRVVVAWDIDARKVGRDVAQAIFAAPNCTAVFAPEVPDTGAVVRMGRILDGVAEHMADHPAERTFVPADAAQPSREEVVAALREARVDVLMNYLPVLRRRRPRFSRP